VTSLSINPDLPKRGEIWLVNFDPTVGAEIKKVRPAVVISSDSVGKLPIKLIAPITDCKSSILATPQLPLSRGIITHQAALKVCK